MNVAPKLHAVLSVVLWILLASCTTLSSTNDHCASLNFPDHKMEYTKCACHGDAVRSLLAAESGDCDHFCFDIGETGAFNRVRGLISSQCGTTVTAVIYGETLVTKLLDTGAASNDGGAAVTASQGSGSAARVEERQANEIEWVGGEDLLKICICKH